MPFKGASERGCIKAKEVGSKTWGAVARTQLPDMVPRVGITSLLQNSEINIKQVSNPRQT